LFGNCFDYLTIHFLFGYKGISAMTDTITTPQMLQALQNMCDTIENEKEYLSELDGAIGDGDHGVNMAKCFRQVKKKLAESSAEDVGMLFKDVGMVVLNSVGGAMGALYGTFFLKLAQQGAGKKEVKLNDLVSMLQTGEKGILDIGKAGPGDKTLIDTLSPAVRAIEAAQKEGKSLPQALADFEAAARQGMTSTKDMLARIGRASRLGERTIGHQDAGATSCYFILRSLASAASY
jgi:dihydroxyacetone kinase-like protein